MLRVLRGAYMNHHHRRKIQFLEEKIIPARKASEEAVEGDGVEIVQ